ncbi:MAG: heme exporter protein CcmB [Nitrospinae bacterium]|nr:heme exporter protein CcmB [Nitrospinota bacterium]
MLEEIKAIIWKDLASELRTKEIFLSMFVFAVLTIIIFIFSIDLRVVNKGDVAPAAIWVAIVFSGTIGLNRSFLHELENDCLSGLMLSPMDRSSIYLGKTIGNLVYMLCMEAMILPVFILFFNLDVSVSLLLKLILVIFLGTLGFVSIGTLLSAMSMKLKAREIMLPILLCTLVIPIIIGSVKVTGSFLDSGGFSEATGWLKLIGAFDIIFLTASFMIFEHLIQE